LKISLQNGGGEWGGLLAEVSFRTNVPYVASQAGWHQAIVVPGGSTVCQRSHVSPYWSRFILMH